MDPVPNFPSYTHDQLEDALAHINRERYPDNYTALMREIQKRAEQGASAEPDSEENAPSFPTGFWGALAIIPTVAFAAFGLYVGGWGLLLIGLTVLSLLEGRVNFQLSPWLCFVLGLILIGIATLCLAPTLFYFTGRKK